MNTAQLYETTIGHRELGGAFTFVVVPARATARPQVVFSPADLIEQLGLTLLEHMPAAPPPPLPPNDASALEMALASVLLQREAHEAQQLMHRLLSASSDERPWLVKNELMLFAAHVATQPVIPFEGSPLDAHSLSTILAQASGTGIGAGAALVAFGSTPLVIVAVPLGMILGGAAAGVGGALEKGLRALLLRLMGVADAATGDTRRDGRGT